MQENLKSTWIQRILKKGKALNFMVIIQAILELKDTNHSLKIWQMPEVHQASCIPSTAGYHLRTARFKSDKEAKEKKEMHVWSLQIMDKLLEHAARRTDEINPNSSETPILLASRNGIVEMVEKILQLFPMAIYDTNGFNQIIVLTAIENRQSHIYDFLLNSSHLIDKEGAFVDKGGNSALHLLEV
ncbi:hypothetical protein CK203_000016 [Vitis vinifera]|uniref:Uncharacterized protein n=1 Tax=Vitis vinifera TaxID=29760 RepID=A0A438KPY8_VITVI|nr:hypothetical protein CK203_000016 [Vitis vinifera]